MAVKDYNSVRPHSSLNYLTPDEFEERIAIDSVFKKKWLDRQIGRYKNVLLLECVQKWYKFEGSMSQVALLQNCTLD